MIEDNQVQERTRSKELQQPSQKLEFEIRRTRHTYSRVELFVANGGVCLKLKDP